MVIKVKWMEAVEDNVPRGKVTKVFFPSADQSFQPNLAQVIDKELPARRLVHINQYRNHTF